ncbi:hypothetical protein [Roseibacillus persicicus]|uniref:Uncharacterized protein n=1 Tax=Roseibacillus persicicus TaxID=454148 RepID=A0A918WH13_9BACT|nr:hypothetical protein [Roseibacillus persicicus]GHC46743.1 hypothetical protein GCM10007100_10500 [Roseibacillus persicicus]
MNLRLFFLTCLLACQSLVAEEAAERAPMSRVVSSDERLQVFGHDNKSISAVLSQVTELRQELNFVVKDPDAKSGNTVFPLQNDLIITLYGEVGDPVPEKLFAIQPRKVDGTSRFRIDLAVHLAKGLNRQRLRETALEALLMDRCLNNSIRDDQPVQVAPWLITGLLERMNWRNGEADRGLYKALFKNGMMMDIEEMVTLTEPDKLDAAERTTFRVSAGAFLMAMLNQEGGERTFFDYLSVAPSYEGEPFLLFRNTFFTAGLSEEGLAKWWALQLANLTQEFVTETLSPLETETALAEILRGDLEGENGLVRTYRLMAFQDILALPEEDRKMLLGPMSERIKLLSFRAFPSYRPLLAGYERITAQLIEGEEEDVADLLMILEEKRNALHEVGIRTRDYLDWYQITNASRLTGEFKDYQRLKQDLESKNPPHPGPVDRYLNAVQNLYDN